MRRIDRNRLTILAVLVLVVTVLHYITATRDVYYHDIYRRLYYIPIVLGGLWFTLRGGLGTSIAISILYAPHVVFQWGHTPGNHPDQYLEILLYNVIGFLTGFLAEREKVQKVRAQKTALRLEQSYSKLREQADLILEIEDQLRRADRLSALGELSAGMAHEIRNPLGAIRGTAEILQDGVDPKDRRYEFTRILIKEVDRLSRVVQDFLDFARPAGSGERGRVAVPALLEDILALSRQQFRQSRVEVALQADEVPAAAGNAEQLKQAFLNLVLNAQQATPPGGRVTLSVAPVGERVRVQIADTGQGIAAENLDRIFNPFFTTRREGTGLGLAITQRIIKGHGGEIEVESRPGEGTTFIVWLLAAAE